MVYNQRILRYSYDDGGKYPLSFRDAILPCIRTSSLSELKLRDDTEIRHCTRSINCRVTELKE